MVCTCSFFSSQHLIGCMGKNVINTPHDNLWRKTQYLFYFYSCSNDTPPNQIKDMGLVWIFHLFSHIRKMHSNLYSNDIDLIIYIYMYQTSGLIMQLRDGGVYVMTVSRM